jgi:hypothetical protein
MSDTLIHHDVNTNPQDQAVSHLHSQMLQLHMDDETEPLVEIAADSTNAYKCGRCCGMLCDTKYEWCRQNDLFPPGCSPYKACQVCAGLQSLAGVGTLSISSIGWCSSYGNTPLCLCQCVCAPSVPCYTAGLWSALAFIGGAAVFTACFCGVQICNWQIHRCDERCPRFVKGFKSYAQERLSAHS